MKILLTTLVLLTVFPTYSLGGWFGSDTYEECLLDEGVKDAKTDAGVRAIKEACKKMHPEYMWERNINSIRTRYPKSYGDLSDCDLVKKVQRILKYSDKYTFDRYGVNPSTCD